MTKSRPKLDGLHRASLQRNDHHRTPAPAKGYADNTPGTTQKPIIHRPEKENNK